MFNQDEDKLAMRLSQIERKLDDLTTRLQPAPETRVRARGANRTDRVFWGIFLVILGGLWLADRMEWVNISAGWLWPSLLVGFGLYLILGGRQR